MKIPLRKLGLALLASGRFEFRRVFLALECARCPRGESKLAKLRHLRMSNVPKQILLGWLILAATSVTSQAGGSHNGFTGECQPEICDYDTVVYDNLSVNVGPGFVAGEYEINAGRLGERKSVR